MGLLERALQYKQQLNMSGKETLIDRIKGPAETEYSKSIDINEIDSLAVSDEKTLFNPVNEQNAFSDIIIPKIINEPIEEDILLLDDYDVASNKKELSVNDSIESELSHLITDKYYSDPIISEFIPDKK